MNGNLHESTEALVGYFRFVHMFLGFCERDSGLQSYAQHKLASFIDCSAKRSKQEVPALGDLLPFTFLTRLPWKDIATPFLDEAFVRNARWALKEQQRRIGDVLRDGDISIRVGILNGHVVDANGGMQGVLSVSFDVVIYLHFTHCVYPSMFHLSHLFFHVPSHAPIMCPSILFIQFHPSYASILLLLFLTEITLTLLVFLTELHLTSVIFY